ncbi:hypothetical protein [Shouchella shacheensis]|uniref:hypothetical protein n=1 Tax=Shouchella shacheensis TaxID=1649580 RepID=UPI00073FCCA6|nr:hypothetical protein [Shouchella shacheensis]
MWILVSMVFFVVSLGITLGGVIGTMRLLPPLLPLGIVVGQFLLCSYVGMFLAAISPSWLGFRFLEVVLAIVSFVFIIACVRSYHPSVGYQPYGKPLFLVLGILFFFMGVQWGMFGYRTFFTLFVTVFFGGAVFLGYLLYNSIVLWVRNVYVAAFLPLGGFLLIAMFKLL